MKSFAAILALTPLALGIALPNPDHVMTVEASCVDPPAQATATVTVTKTIERGELVVGGTGAPAPPPAGDNQNPPPTQVEPVPATGATHEVMVGAFPQGEGLPPRFEFRPNTLNAPVGDTINFKMMTRAHSVTQSTFDTPCIRKPDGFDTDLVPIESNDLAQFRPFVVQNATAPTWFYCKQRNMNHCGSGMVFGLNPINPAQMQEFIDSAIRQNGTAAATSSVAAAPTSIGGYVAMAMS